MTSYNYAKLKIKVFPAETNPKYELITFDGDLDKLGLESIRDQIDEVTEKIEKQYLVFDFTLLSFINSESIGYLLTTHSRLVKKGKILVIVNAAEHVKDVLEVIGMTKLVKMYPSLTTFESENLR